MGCCTPGTTSLAGHCELLLASGASVTQPAQTRFAHPVMSAMMSDINHL